MQTTHSEIAIGATASIMLGLAITTAVAAGYTVAAFRARRDRGTRTLLQLWIGATLVLSLLSTTFAVRNLAALRTPTARDMVYFALLYFIVFLFGLGAVTWRVQRRVKRDPQARLTGWTVLSGVAVFFLALFVLALPLLILDAARLF